MSKKARKHQDKVTGTGHNRSQLTGHRYRYAQTTIFYNLCNFHTKSDSSADVLLARDIVVIEIYVLVLPDLICCFGYESPGHI